jgi:peptidyl-prolyl cis-trans isomerase SurA
MIPRLSLRPGACALALAAVAALALPAQAQVRPPAAGASSAPRQADYIVAVVNSEPITNSEVRTRLLMSQPQGGQQLSRQELAKEVLEALVTERVLLQEARDMGLKVDDSQLVQAEQNLARQNRIDVPELHRRLAADGISPAAFREDLRRRLLLNRLRERELTPRGIQVTEQEIDQFLAEQRAGDAGAPAELNLAQILVAVPENATEAQVQALRAKAQGLQQRARAGEDFAALAKQSSDAAGAAANGGAFGLRPADRYPSLFLDAVRDLPVGGVSEVVRSGAGFHVLKLLERESPGMMLVQSRARHILLRLTPPLTEAAARARLADFKRRVEAGQADFATLARQYSQDGSAANGGDLGWVNPGAFVPEFEEVMNELAPGRIADPFTSRFGVHLLQLLERRQVALKPDEQRQVARNLLREKKAEDNFNQWTQNMRARAWVEMREPPQ